MPDRIEKPGTAVQFVYRCSVSGCGHEDRYQDAVVCMSTSVMT